MIMAGLRLRDLRQIRAALVACLLLASLALALALGCHLRLLDARSARSQGERDLVEAQQRLISMEAEEADYRARLQRYRDIAGLGKRRAQSRLDWLAQLRQAATHHHVVALEYTFAAQHAGEAKSRSNPELRVSPLELRLSLRHEEDLLGLLGELTTAPGALLRLRACSIERIPVGTGRQADARLKAECSIDWLSLHEAA